MSDSLRPHGLQRSSSVHVILQARILGWVAISSCRGSSQPRDGTPVSRVSCIGRQNHCATWEAPKEQGHFKSEKKGYKGTLNVKKKQTCSTWNSRSKCTRFFYVRNFSSSCYWCIPLSQPEVPITEFQMRMQG